MIYFTVMQPPKYHQITIEELLFGKIEDTPVYDNNNITATRTYEMECISDNIRRKSNINIHHLIKKLCDFNESTEHLRNMARHSLYKTFYIPKKSGRGWRRIDAPESELMESLRVLKSILENDFKLLYHTSAFAYIKKRCTIDAVKKHQLNNSKWFAKLDLSNFFGSTTPDFVMKMFSMIYPMSEIVKIPQGKEALEKAIELAFLDGGLPQGTPISPIITNVMMIPIDYRLSNGFRNFDEKNFVYTRYADDFLISSKVDFDIKKIEKFVNETLEYFDAPFKLNSEKSRYGSSAGRNWNLGVMLNKDNEITVGHKKKRQLKSMMYNYISDKRKGINWDVNDIQIMMGLYSYYRMVEKDTIDAIVNHLSESLGIDIIEAMKAEIQAGHYCKPYLIGQHHVDDLR